MYWHALASLSLSVVFSSIAVWCTLSDEWILMMAAYVSSVWAAGCHSAFTPTSVISLLELFYLILRKPFEVLYMAYLLLVLSAEFLRSQVYTNLVTCIREHILHLSQEQVSSHSKNFRRRNFVLREKNHNAIISFTWGYWIFLSTKQCFHFFLTAYTFCVFVSYSTIPLITKRFCSYCHKTDLSYL